jgi:serine/threonine-protein kinase RsbW
MNHGRILAKVARDEFVGRDAELRQLATFGAELDSRRVLVLAAPNSGASEFLRQSYDELFFRRDVAVPIHFAFDLKTQTRFEVGASFFRSFLQQYIAYRRVDPSLCVRPLTLHESTELALPTDYEAITSLVEAFERERTAADETSFLRFCLAAPEKLAAETKRKLFPLLDCVALARESSDSALANEIATAFLQRDAPVVMAGLRRHVLNLVHAAGADLDSLEIIHLETLDDDDAQRLVDVRARSFNIDSNEQTRDLIVQQFGGSTFFISALVQAAREKQTMLTSFLDCQRLYVDELMGGRIHRHFARLLDHIAPQPHTRRTLLRVLHESSLGETRRSSLWTWKKRLGVEGSEFERIIEALHVYEFANASGATIELNSDSTVWMDYLRANYQIDVAGEQRALTVSKLLLATLKRAPEAMARKYRRAVAVGLDELLARFNCQQVPAALLYYDRFAAAHAGEDLEAINTSLDAESELVRLPQIVQVMDCKALATAVITEEKRCAVAHGFDAADYTDQSEIVWIAAEIDSKLPAGEELVKESCDRLMQIARECEFKRVRLWLVSREGFAPEASDVLKERDVYSSSHRQIELLTARLLPDQTKLSEAAADEYEMVIPMATDTELIAAHTIEQIARRINFAPEAINQIKLALVEACINAAEHSLSPDRKIYQRFRVEDDKLVVTVASRGVVPANLAGQNGGANGNGKSRRGWGLKLIRTLMDEVEFERVDDGTQLRMVKYIR